MLKHLMRLSGGIHEFEKGVRCLPFPSSPFLSFPTTNLVHSKPARNPPVAIILNILSTMFYGRTIKI